MLSRALKTGAIAVILLAVSLTLLPGSDPWAQSGPNVFENPKNLKVLPEDISPKALRAAMMLAATGLGVRCWFCHIGEEGQDLSTFDFVSDEKAHKQVARVMFQMVLDVNGTHMPKVAELEGEDAEVRSIRCVTCHAGKPEPEE